MGNKQTGYFVYNSAVEGPDFNYHQDYNQGPYNHEGMCKTNPTIIQRLVYSLNMMIPCDENVNKIFQITLDFMPESESLQLSLF